MDASHEKTSSAADRRFMRMALRLARRGLGHTRPNPPVGAVIVKNGEVVGRGYHRAAGGPHAEVEAIYSNRELDGATLYVTLEPCSTHGKTPPCTSLIIDRKIRRVCVSAIDPNPAHSGRGIEILRQAGLEVTTGVCRAQGDELIAPFAKRITTGMPLVTLKLALTLDGKLADRTGRSQWITGEKARRWVQRLRRGADAVMVGGTTAATDNPNLRCRLPGAGSPWRVIISGSGALPASLNIFNDAYAANTLVATTSAGADKLARKLAESPAVVWGFEGDIVPLDSLLQRLSQELGVMHIVCEGGGRLAGGLLRAGLVDRLACVYAPVVLGDSAAIPSFVGCDHLLPQAPRGQTSQVRRLGDDILVEVNLKD